MLNRKWNAERPLIFSHVVLTRTLGARKDREIQVRIDRQLDLWERGIHAGMVGDALAEGRAREGHIKQHDKEEDNCLARNFSQHLAIRKAATGSPSGHQP